MSVVRLVAEREARKVRPCATCAHRIGLRMFPGLWRCGVHGATCFVERYDHDDDATACGVHGKWWEPRKHR